MRILIVAGALLAMSQTPAAAGFLNNGQNGTWCLDASDLGIVDCGYFSFKQCDTTRSGLGGICYRNPWLDSQRRRSARRR